MYFGMAAAENEVAEDPDRFLDTYFDRWSLIHAVEEHSRFLVLGPKGTGKSAAAHYVRLAWSRKYGPESVFSTFVDFDELNRTQSPLSALDKRLVGDVPALTDSAWRLFLGVRLLDSLIADPASSLSRDPQALELVDRLRVSGLATNDFPQVLRRVRQRRGTLAIPALGSVEGGSSESDQVSVSQLGEALLRLAVKADTPNKHLLAIDGLDKAIGDNSAYWQTLAALVRVADSLTRSLKAAGAKHTYVMIMCRSDVFRRVRFADAAKIAADGAVHMDWGAEAEDPQDVQLWEYIAHKAQAGASYLLNQMPEAIRVGGHQKVACDRYLLQFTRYTPRDMTLLFSTLQQINSSGRLSNSEVRRAVDTFSTRHLLTEIMSEATGLLPDLMIDRFESILSSLPRRIFEREDLEAAMRGAGFNTTVDVDQFGEYLFLQGAIGNYRRGAGYVQFYHRRDAYKWQKSGPWVMHSGLVYAFNLPWANAPASKGIEGRTSDSQSAEGADPSRLGSWTTRQRRRTRGGMPLALE
ncbi:P-loop ATPase, Sll1717 family [Geodermatophilus sp. SYSU D00779]